MTDHAELRRLAEEVIRIERNEDEPISAAWELFDSAANPTTILALLDEIDGLKAEKEALRKFAAEAYQVLGALDAPENVLNNASDAASGDPLRHETLLPFFAEDYEALRKDAARYRWLRERDLETIRQGGVFAGMTPENIVLNQEDLDAEIDAALEGETQ
ncbi:hypothetical protein L4643_002451 [Pseudomonas aeruginosa]|nr:hypothetical protein [Pseudomonas aeruginosa]MBG6277895.1 hypothetical protein [Pseudomonas aeruginosa]HCA6709200.1 hypothetical protein [Pseudomonas aeruginosa]HEJ2236459.1 hypothetical protein [Pseudomonas aeruginosa]HEJ2523045.1 hypothetical protein [Pseudomonas aeruginosa]